MSFDLTSLEDLQIGDPLEKHEPFEVSQYYHKPESEYKTISEIVNHIKTREKAVNVSSESLRVNGHLIQDSFEKYLNSAYNSSNMLKKALLTPRHYTFEKEYNEELQKYKSKKHFDLGTFLHQCILEPTKFSRVIVEPPTNRSIKKELINLCEFWKKECIERGIQVQPFETLEDMKNDEIKKLIENMKTSCNLQSVTASDYIKIKAAKNSFDMYGGGILHEIMKRSKREVSLYYKDEETNIPLRIRPDAIQFSENIGVNACISVKSTSASDTKKFMSDCARYHYDLSEAMYLDILRKVTGRDFDTCLMIMFQTSEPYSIAVFRWRPEDIAIGHYKYRYALNNIKDFENNPHLSYDSYAEEGNAGIIDSCLPSWNAVEFPPVNYNV